MAITFTSGSATIGATEYSLPNNSTTLTQKTDDCMLQVWIDFANMAAGDEYEATVYEVVGGSAQRAVYDSRVEGAQGLPLVLPSLLVGEGWDVTVRKIAGTDRLIRWSLRKVA